MHSIYKLDIATIIQWPFTRKKRKEELQLSISKKINYIYLQIRKQKKIKNIYTQCNNFPWNTIHLYSKHKIHLFFLLILNFKKTTRKNEKPTSSSPSIRHKNTKSSDTKWKLHPNLMHKLLDNDKLLANYPIVED